MQSDQSIHSFVVRFVDATPAAVAAEGAEPPQPVWHGTVRHVQSETELRFTRWQDAVAFIARYVDIGHGDEPA
jgi:hypothetical protein